MNEIEVFTARRGLTGPASTVPGPAPSVAWEGYQLRVGGILGPSLRAPANVITFDGTTIEVDGVPGPNLKGDQGDQGDQGEQGITRRQLLLSMSDKNEILQLGSPSNLFFDAPFAGTITGWSLGANSAFSCVVDVLKNGSSITASARPTLTNQAKVSSTALTGWTTSFVTGDRFTLDLKSNSGANGINLILLAQEAV